MGVQETKVAQAAKVITGEEGSARAAWMERLGEGPQRFKKFIHEVRVEMSHVTWPPLAEVRSTTFIVIVTIFFFGVFFFVVDMGVSKVVELILKRGKL